LAGILVAAAGCDGGAGGSPKSTTVWTNTWADSNNRKLDLLFMVDGAGSEDTIHANLKENLGNLMDVFKGLPGGLPDIHIAVVTSDLGAGNGTDIPGCGADTALVAGDGGVFRSAPGGGCPATGLDAGATFISSTGGSNPVTNFGAQDITTVLQCIINIGTTSCGFRHQLASVARALGADGRAAPPENAGFLREDATLGIVLLTDADDCSAPAGSPLFNPISTSLHSMFGPTETFVCNEWGHLCTLGGTSYLPPSRFAPNNSPTDTVTYSPAGGPDNCISAESVGMLTPVGTIADGIKALKADPANQIQVAVFAGPTTPYVVSWRTPPLTDVGPWPEIKNSCGGGGAATGLADPGVRMHQFATEFGAAGLTDTICQVSYGASLNTIATKLSAVWGPACVTGKVATRPGSTSPDCAVTQLSPNPNDPAKPVQSVIQACADNVNSRPCWQLTPSPAGSGCDGETFVIDRAVTPPSDTRITTSCALCLPDHPDPSRGCP
jgi:hypothetical protein